MDDLLDGRGWQRLDMSINTYKYTWKLPGPTGTANERNWGPDCNFEYRLTLMRTRGWSAVVKLQAQTINILLYTTGLVEMSKMEICEGGRAGQFVQGGLRNEFKFKLGHLCFDWCSAGIPIKFEYWSKVYKLLESGHLPVIEGQHGWGRVCRVCPFYSSPEVLQICIN